MDKTTYEDHLFEKETHTGEVLRGYEFIDCTFKNCDFSSVDFNLSKFIDCTFEGCNLSLVKLSRVSLTNAVFKGCKIMGVNFTDCHSHLFSVEFENCILDYASFMGKKMLKTKFIRCSLKETSFTQAILTGSVFDEANLLDAVFNRTDLTQVNFATAYNYTIDPELNILKKAVFSHQGLPGLLFRHDIKIV